MGQAQRVDNYTGCLKIRKFQIQREFCFSNYYFIRAPLGPSLPLSEFGIREF
jgi:hypothetical protein